MKIERFVLGVLRTNTYLLKEGDYVILIDPASKADNLINTIGNDKLLAILLTHGHFDHINAVDELYRHYSCPIYINKNDEELVRDKNAGKEFGIVSYISSPLSYLNDGIMNIGPFKFEAINTPGHTKGSVLFIFENNIFSGDTLFKCSVGRTDLKGGSEKDLKKSLPFFKELNKDYNILPGHDEPTTLFYELSNNPFLF